MEKNKKYIDALKEKAEEICKELKCPYVGTEHLFLCILSDKTSSVTTYLNKYNISKKVFKEQFEHIIGKGKTAPTTINYTPLAKGIIGEVLRIAGRYGIDVTSELVTLELLRSGEGVAIRLLDSLGFDGDLQNDFDDFLCEQIRTANIGTNLGDEFDTDNEVVSMLKGDSVKDRFNCLTDLRKSVKDNNTRVVGFEKELEELIKALLRYKKPNVILIGEPGVGKTALVEKLAIAINEGKVPPIIADYRIIQLSLSSALAGTKYRGEFEEKMENVLSAVSKSKNTVLFIDEIHNIVGAGASSESTLDASNILKPYLARGSIKLIGATTNEEYERIKEDGALARRFKTIEILEPNVEQTLAILRSMKPVMLKQYGVKLTEKNLKEIYHNSTFRKGRMPDVALDEMEEYCINIYYEESKKVSA